MTRTPIFTPVLLAGCVILMAATIARASFGLFQLPIATEFGWPRADFSLALAIQSLAWGIGQPLFSALAEKLNDRVAVLLGGASYIVGLVLSAAATTPLAHQGLAILIGFGIAGMGFGLVLAVVGRAAGAANRSMAMAIASAAGSAGQVIGPPLAGFLLGRMPWQPVFLVFAAIILASMAVVPWLRAPPVTARAEPPEAMGAVVARALRDPSFALIFIGFFSCGYQLAFISAHLPAMIVELSRPILPGGMLDALGISTTSALGAAAIAVIGLANIGGTLLAGWAGNRFSKKYLLAGIYTARTLVSAGFILVPITPATVLVFAALMGALWLATVPLTAGLIGHIYGMRYMGTLYGIVFFSHQLGGFVGAWLGGRLYDAYGTYTTVWWVGVAIAALSALVHLPVRERRPAMG